MVLPSQLGQSWCGKYQHRCAVPRGSAQVSWTWGLTLATAPEQPSVGAQPCQRTWAWTMPKAGACHRAEHPLCGSQDLLQSIPVPTSLSAAEHPCSSSSIYCQAFLSQLLHPLPSIPVPAPPSAAEHSCPNSSICCQAPLSQLFPPLLSIPVPTPALRSQQVSALLFLPSSCPSLLQPRCLSPPLC